MQRKEALVKIYNEIMERRCRQEIDIHFFEAKAIHFKKKSPERAQETQKSEAMKAELFWSEMLLKTIKSLIDKE